MTMNWALSGPSAEDVANDVQELRETVERLTQQVFVLTKANNKRDYDDLRNNLKLSGYYRGTPPALRTEHLESDMKAFTSGGCEACKGALRFEPYTDSDGHGYRIIVACIDCQMAREF